MSVEMTLEQAAEDMRSKINSGVVATSWNLGTYVDAIDAHLAKAGEPFDIESAANDFADEGCEGDSGTWYPNKDATWFLTQFVNGLPALYAAPPSAEPAQRVAWYLDCQDPETGIAYRTLTFNKDDVTNLHKPLWDTDNGAAPAPDKERG